MQEKFTKRTKQETKSIETDETRADIFFAE